MPKTDEMKIQSYPQLLDEIKGLPYIITNKYDGTSFTAYYFNEIFGFCSRNLELQPGDDVYSRMVKKYNIDQVLPQYCKKNNINISIQGEICGKAIAKNNPLDLQVDELFIFSIFDINKRQYFGYDEMKKIANDLGLKVVCEDSRGECFNFTLEKLIETAKGNYPGTNKKREGIVIRPLNPKYSQTIGNQLSFKCINNEYLLDNKL